MARVIIDEANHAMELIVPDDQLSLAIGRRGQNVRLAAQLTGWKLDINSETRVREMREFASRSLGALPGVTEMLVETLYAHGFRQARDVAEASPEVLAQIPGLDPARIPAMQEQAKKQMVDDEIELRRLEMEREQARAIEARRHPDELSPVGADDARPGDEREDGRVAGPVRLQDARGAGPARRTSPSWATLPAVGIKKARQLKSAAESYLLEEAKLRAELDAERAALGASASAPPSTEEAKAP